MREQADDSTPGYSWVGGAVGFLEHGDRMAVTGDGGSSKSHTSFQWAIQLASGINPVGGRCTPVPTLIVNFECGEDTVREMCLHIDSALGSGTAAPVFIRAMRPFDIGDESDTTAAEISRLVQSESINFVAIGPGKSMIGPHVFGDAGRGDSRAVALRDFLDSLTRLPSTPAVVPELHTGYTEIRPKGGDWLGWASGGTTSRRRATTTRCK